MSPGGALRNGAVQYSNVVTGGVDQANMYKASEALRQLEQTPSRNLSINDSGSFPPT